MTYTTSTTNSYYQVQDTGWSRTSWFNNSVFSNIADAQKFMNRQIEQRGVSEYDDNAEPMQMRYRINYVETIIEDTSNAQGIQMRRVTTTTCYGSAR